MSSRREPLYLLVDCVLPPPRTVLAQLTHTAPPSYHSQIIANLLTYDFAISAILTSLVSIIVLPLCVVNVSLVRLITGS